MQTDMGPKSLTPSVVRNTPLKAAIGCGFALNLELNFKSTETSSVYDLGTLLSSWQISRPVSFFLKNGAWVSQIRHQVIWPF